MSEWQPIEMAPKDGATIAIFCYNGERWNEVFWHRGFERWAMRWAGPGGMRGVIIPDGQPTHWMPLPPPPGSDPGIPVYKTHDATDEFVNPTS